MTGYFSESRAIDLWRLWLSSQHMNCDVSASNIAGIELYFDFFSLFFEEEEFVIVRNWGIFDSSVMIIKENYRFLISFCSFIGIVLLFCENFYSDELFSLL